MLNGVIALIETKAFTARIGELLSDDQYRFLQLELARQPTAGPVIPGTGGLRKLRWALAGRGKRGGARVIYYWHAASATILMLFVYPKNELEDLSRSQRELLRRIVASEYP
jgi:mRNA-degrading endonuclease RelE of RelBE toxin-antitoxin system